MCALQGGTGGPVAASGRTGARLHSCEAGLICPPVGGGVVFFRLSYLLGRACLTGGSPCCTCLAGLSQPGGTATSDLKGSLFDARRTINSDIRRVQLKLYERLRKEGSVKRTRSVQTRHNLPLDYF